MSKYKCLKSDCYFHEDIELHSIEKEDVEKIRKWRNSQKDILRQNKNIRPKEQLLYYKLNIWSEITHHHPKNILFGIRENNSLVGYGGLTNVSWNNNRAEISFVLNPKINKKEYKKIFTQFLELIKSVSFSELNFKKLFTETFSNRRYHISILEDSGFILEGVLKKHVVIKNDYKDSLIHANFSKEL